MHNSRFAFEPGTLFATIGAALVVLVLTTAATHPENRPQSVEDPALVVKRLYAAFDRGDMDAVLDAVSEDVTWTQYGPEYVLPFSGVFHGRAGVADFFRKVDETLTDVHAGQREFMVSGNRVIVPGWEESTVRATGGHYRVDNVHIFTVTNGRISRFEEFIENGDVVEAFAPADAARGKALFTGCAACHGDGAEGRPAMHAPNLSGLDRNYLIRQLRDFRARVRGSDVDTYGYMMIGRANALPGDRGIRDVVAFIETLPPTRRPASADGDATKGSVLYRSCAPCHGAGAEGNVALSAPALEQQDDGYLRTQLEHFSSGVRGSNAADDLGRQMRSATTPLSGEQAIADVVAFIKSM